MGDHDAKQSTAESHGSDTARDQMANERTMLAWARTGIAVMALGFVVARFGLLIRELRPLVPQRLPQGTSTALGTALVGCGAVLLVLATRRYLNTGRAIVRNEYRWSPGLVVALSLVLVLVAGLLGAYLLLGA